MQRIKNVCFSLHTQKKVTETVPEERQIGISSQRL